MLELAVWGTEKEGKAGVGLDAMTKVADFNSAFVLGKRFYGRDPKPFVGAYFMALIAECEDVWSWFCRHGFPSLTLTPVS